MYYFKRTTPIADANADTNTSKAPAPTSTIDKDSLLKASP
jgi:hypothetical protein